MVYVRLNRLRTVFHQHDARRAQRLESLREKKRKATAGPSAKVGMTILLGAGRIVPPTSEKRGGSNLRHVESWKICTSNTIVIPTGAYPGFPTSRAQQRPRMRLSVKESRTNFINATKLNKQVGGAERRDLLWLFSRSHTGAGPHLCFIRLWPDSSRAIIKNVSFSGSLLGLLWL
jgi:hypothetical protein